MPEFDTMTLMKRRLMYVITKGSWGGAGVYVFDLATALKGEYDVTVAVGGGGLLVSKLHAEKIRTITIPTLERDIHTLSDVRAFFDLWRIFRRERPDIVHVNSSKAGALGALAARLSRVPHVVYTVHGWAFNEPVSEMTRFFRWAVSLLTMLLCHRTITVSHFDMILSPLGLHSVTIHNGIEASEFLTRERARHELCTRTGMPEDAFIVGTIAELHVNKGIDILIQAAYLIDDIHVCIIGEGEEREALTQLINDLDLRARVHLVGFLPNASRYLKAFDIFALPSRKEGLPYTILEAGLAEVPVIASAIGGIPEIVSDQLSGDLVHAFNDEALAESIRELMQSPNTRARFAASLKARVERYFNLRGMIKKTTAVYER